MHIDEAIRSRKSVRRFLPTPVPAAVVSHILEVAARAPSGNNVQPWRVYVLAGEARDGLCADIVKAAQEDPDRYQPEYAYATLGIARDDQAARERQMLRNYSFFDAPVGLLVTLDRRLNTGSFMDVGMFIQNVMVAARAQGLHTCAQAAFAWFHKVTRQHLPMGDNEILLCGIALGHEDLQAPENAFITERAPLADFVSFHGMQACPDSPAR
jgi:nitroreductase